MAYVVAEPCVGCKYTDCVVVCPCECFYGDDRQLYIDPDDCIDCGACLPECPIGAIVDSVDADPAYAKINADLSPTFKNNPPAPLRPPTDPPRRPENKLTH